jgi:Na+-transporting methylmalonyl-CoA/oxaloacetate decarboxylase gamma subunit
MEPRLHHVQALLATAVLAVLVGLVLVVVGVSRAVVRVVGGSESDVSPPAPTEAEHSLWQSVDLRHVGS